VEGEFTGVILANEFLDALPVHRLVMQEGVLAECYVGWSEGWFSEIRGGLSDEGLGTQLRAEGVELADGQRAEVCLAAPSWLRSVAADLRGGIILIIDYGHDAAELYSARRRAGSLVTYREHEAGDDPFEAVGHQDITAHVDISALGRAAGEAGLSAAGSTTQGHFLADLGLGEMLVALGQEPTTSTETYVAARASVARLLDPRHLGAFRVLAWERRGDIDDTTDVRLRGFGAGA
jgi:SAM-dependent MidA family methyltransferase